MPTLFSVDISEDALHHLLKDETFDILLRDHTRKEMAQKQSQSKIEDKDCDAYHIIWATKDYEKLGAGYGEKDMITAQAILNNRHLIVPRSVKDPAVQRFRTQDKAEVFTPAWICNAQNNLIDTAWFGQPNVFNTEQENHTWITNPHPIIFPEGKTWKDYIRDTRLEITCGEAPYLVSRYDTTTGEMIPIHHRIGLLDRKLRVLNENVDNHEDWLCWAQVAYQNIYGYEWQGDNLLLAREALLLTFLEYHEAKFGKDYPLQMKSIRYIAYIISWNIFQMDGLKGVIPNTCHEEIIEETDLFGDTKTTRRTCKGCANGNIREHNGVYALIRDWEAKSETKRKIRFIDLIKRI